MKTNLITSLQAYLLSFHLEDEEPRVLHSDLWNEQLKYLEEETPFPTPAVFIELLPNSWAQKNNTEQEADLRINFHILHTSPMECIQLCDYLNYALARFRTPDTARPVRENSTPDHDHGQLCDFVEQYRIKINDNTASNEANQLLLKLKTTKS
jgi:hypothetical protein